MLVKRFKDILNEALRKMQEEKFINYNARLSYNIRLYISLIVRHAKAIKFLDII